MNITTTELAGFTGIEIDAAIRSKPEIMNTQNLEQLAHQLRIDKTPACRRAINRILEEMKKRCENGEYADPMAAESAFRKFIEDEQACQKAKAVKFKQ